MAATSDILMNFNQNSYYLPLWFQDVKGFDPVTTGVDFIPRLLPQLVSLVLAGTLVKRFGQYIPYMLIGEPIAIGGQAMLTQIRTDSSTLYWAASLVVSDIGTGIAMQLPYTAVAVTLSDKDVPVGNAVAVLFYQLEGALFISIGQNITISTLIDLLPKALPHLSPSRVIDGMRRILKPSQQILQIWKCCAASGIQRSQEQ